MFLILITIFLCVFSYKWLSRVRKPSKIPYGPMPLPLLGNIHQLGNNPPVQLAKWAEKYGKLYRIHMGPQPALIINDAGLIRQLFSRIETIGRIKTLTSKDIFPEGGMIRASGKAWLEQRPFFVKCLKRFERASGLEATVGHQVSELGDWFEGTMKSTGKIYLFEQLKATYSNIIWVLLSGNREETHIASILEEWVHSVQRISNTGAMLFDLIATLFPVWSGRRHFQKCSDNIRNFVIAEFEREKENGAESESMIASYLKLVENTTDPDSIFCGEKGYRQSVDSGVSMILGGTETTASSLNWMIFYLCVNQPAQRRLQQEVDEIGGEVGLRDRTRMPYTEAVIMETLRKASPAPGGVVHRVLQDFEWEGEIIEKDTLLMANIYYVHHDKKIWGDPEVFRPERFLDEGKNLKEFMVAFSPGKRACPGEQLARDMLFLTITNLLRKYTFEKDPSVEDEMYMKASMDFLSVAQPVPVILKNR